MSWTELKREDVAELGYTNTFLWGYRKDRTSIVCLALAFGQYRLQAWFDNGGLYPDILEPVC